MLKKLLAIMLIAVLPVVLYAGTTGKIAGVVRDKETGEPLAGANVQVVDTYLGTATDADGNFIILNVPVGRLDIKVTYMGYTDMIKQGVRVSVDLTTDVIFEMVTTALEGETVVITAERAMIRRDETNTNIIRTAEEIEVLPIRGMQNISASVAGVVKVDNSTGMNIRGGRNNENAIYVDGVLVNDPYNTAVRVQVPNEAIEELSVQTGGFNAEYGHAMSGIIIMTTNSGTDKYHGSLQAITDEFLSYDTKDFELGTYSYGYNEYVATLGGPIIPGKRHTFFISGTRKYEKDGAPSYGWAYNDNKPADFAGGIVPGQSDESWSGTAKMRFQLTKSIELKSSAVYTSREFSFTGIWSGMNPIWLYNIQHAPQTKTSHLSINGTLTHTLSPTTYYDFKVNYFDTWRKTYDRMFGDDIMKYGDPTYVPDATYAADASKYGERYLSLIEPDFMAPGVQYFDYFRNETQYWGVDFDITHQLGKYHSLKAGFDYNYHTLREMRILTPYQMASRSDLTFAERLRLADVRFYGYKYTDLGNGQVGFEETDSGDYLTDAQYNAAGGLVDGFAAQAPYHPITMSAYIQDKIEFEDLVLNLGLRYDRIDPNAWNFKDIEADFADDGTYIDGGMFGGDQRFSDDDTEDSEAFDYISPRLGVSFPVSDVTIFHAQFGRFYQKPNLADLYLSPFYLDAWVNRGGYFTTLDNPNLRPEKTTSYEVGFKRMLSDNSSLQLTAFYKETENLIQVLNVQTDVTNVAFTTNGDFGSVKGFDIIYNLRRTKNISASLNYEFQIAKGTGSATNSNFDIAWQRGSRGHFPKFIQPLGFEQRHRGTVNVDYRMGEGEGPEVFGVKPLEHFGANILFTFNSGSPYTRTTVINNNPHTGRYDNDISNVPISAVNAEVTPWNYRFDLKIDRSFALPYNLKLNAFIWVLNLLNTETVIAVWGPTGLPDDTGYAQTSSGEEYYQDLTASEIQQVSMREMDYINYGIPRQIRAGIQIEF